MPRDLWRRARDRAIARQAKREFASEGHPTFPYVWGDNDPLPFDPPAPAEEPEPLVSGPKRAVWCVLNDQGSPVAWFEFRNKKAADDLAASLTSESGINHYAARVKVPMEPALRKPVDPAVFVQTVPATAARNDPSATPARRLPWYRALWKFILRLVGWHP
jgi:hypothetical protein